MTTPDRLSVLPVALKCRIVGLLHLRSLNALGCTSNEWLSFVRNDVTTVRTETLGELKGIYSRSISAATALPLAPAGSFVESGNAHDINSTCRRIPSLGSVALSTLRVNAIIPFAAPDGVVIEFDHVAVAVECNRHFCPEVARWLDSRRRPGVMNIINRFAGRAWRDGALECAEMVNRLGLIPVLHFSGEYESQVRDCMELLGVLFDTLPRDRPVVAVVDHAGASHRPVAAVVDRAGVIAGEIAALPMSNAGKRVALVARASSQREAAAAEAPLQVLAHASFTVDVSSAVSTFLRLPPATCYTEAELGSHGDGEWRHDTLSSKLRSSFPPDRLLDDIFASAIVNGDATPEEALAAVKAIFAELAPRSGVMVHPSIDAAYSARCSQHLTGDSPAELELLRICTRGVRHAGRGHAGREIRGAIIAGSPLVVDALCERGFSAIEAFSSGDPGPRWVSAESPFGAKIMGFAHRPATEKRSRVMEALFVACRRALESDEGGAQRALVEHFAQVAQS